MSTNEITLSPNETKMITIKQKLMASVESEIKRREWTQRHAAKELQCSQPRVSNLVNGKVEFFSIDSLTEMIVRLGGEIDYTVTMG